jgi:hypothetical protein
VRYTGLGTVYLAVGALSKCGDDLLELLSLMGETMSQSEVLIKWIVTSRNRDDLG